MSKILKVLKTRTFWAVLTMFLFSGMESVNESIPKDLYNTIMGILGYAVVYFRANPRVDFTRE